MDPSVSQLMNVKQAALYLGVSESWLNKKRGEGNGPKFVKLGRRVLYDSRDLAAYVLERKLSSTSEYKPAEGVIYL